MSAKIDQAMLAAINWNSDGLVPAIAQQYDSGKVLMLAWMNRQALSLTITEQRAVYFSRSRQKLWRKGEQSGHVQQLKEIRIDCDNDVVLMQVAQIGGIACHTGRYHCFYKKLIDNRWVEVELVIKDPGAIYGDA